MTATRLERDALQAALLERLPEFVRGYVPADTPVRELGGEIRAGAAHGRESSRCLRAGGD